MTNPLPAVTVHGVDKGTESQHRTRTRVTRDRDTAVLRIPVTNPNVQEELRRSTHILRRRCLYLLLHIHALVLITFIYLFYDYLVRAHSQYMGRGGVLERTDRDDITTLDCDFM